MMLMVNRIECGWSITMLSDRSYCTVLQTQTHTHTSGKISNKTLQMNDYRALSTFILAAC